MATVKPRTIQNFVSVLRKDREELDNSVLHEIVKEFLPSELQQMVLLCSAEMKKFKIPVQPEITEKELVDVLMENSVDYAIRSSGEDITFTMRLNPTTSTLYESFPSLFV